MKNLKYIKLFEAFESSKISKTLAFVNKSSREKFIEKLNNIAKSIDFPVSELSDKYLQYLPFNKALELNASFEDTPCTATSEGEFSQYGIAGEKCESGVMKRKWGRSVRAVACPHCSGTGIEPKTEYPIKWVKFWFDKDGNYVETSATDGKVRNQTGGNLSAGEISQNLSDYEVVKELTHQNLKNLTTGDYVKITLTDGNGRSLIGRAFKEPRRPSVVYIIQNFCQGSEPDYTSAWKKYGKSSWVIDSGSEYTGTPILLKPKAVEKDEKPNPYTWNALLGRNFSSVQSESDMKTKLSKAHFAIVLDYLELKNSEFSKRSDIQTKRKEQTTGALAFQSDEDIRRENINRYIEEINKRVQFSSDFSTVKNLVFRLFGLSKFGYYVLRGRHFSDFDTIITYMFRFLKNSEDQEFYYTRIVESLKPRIKSNIEFNKESDTIMKEIFSKGDDYLKPLYPKLEELNTAIYNKFRSFELNNIEDIEVFFEKMKSLRSLWRESQRFELLRNHLYYPIENMSDKWRFERYISQITDDVVEPLINDIDRFISVLNKI